MTATELAGRDLVAGVVPGQPPGVIATAVEWARIAGAPMIHFAFVDPSRMADDGRELPVDPDTTGARRDGRERRLRAELTEALAGAGVAWEFRYLVGAADRELAALADEVNAALLIVGTRRSGWWPELRELMEGSVAAGLAARQHRPVLVVPDPAAGPR